MIIAYKISRWYNARLTLHKVTNANTAILKKKKTHFGIYEIFSLISKLAMNKKLFDFGFSIVFVNFCSDFSKIVEKTKPTRI